MLVLPVSIREPEIAALVDGAMTALVRPMGRLALVKARDLLWVREPFHVAKRFDNIRPTAAVNRGAVPIFAVDKSTALVDLAELGRRRHAREMPKAWHRQHLRVTAIDRLPLHNVTDADLRAAGWRSRGHFEIRWDQDAAFSGPELARDLLWAANPTVLRIQFDRVATPLPADAMRPARERNAA